MNHKYKLFVDDMRPIPEGWIGARTVSEAIAVLATLPVGEVSLDHDILYRPAVAHLYQALSHETFKGVAYYISAMTPDRRPKKIRVHTSNAGAAITMCEILGDKMSALYEWYQPENYK